MIKILKKSWKLFPNAFGQWSQCQSYPAKGISLSLYKKWILMAPTAYVNVRKWLYNKTCLFLPYPLSLFHLSLFLLSSFLYHFLLFYHSLDSNPHTIFFKDKKKPKILNIYQNFSLLLLYTFQNLLVQMYKKFTKLKTNYLSLIFILISNENSKG